jgi:hypothetical protein
VGGGGGVCARAKLAGSGQGDVVLVQWPSKKNSRSLFRFRARARALGDLPKFCSERWLIASRHDQLCAIHI